MAELHDPEDSDLVNTMWIDRERCPTDTPHNETLIEPGRRMGELSLGASNEKIQMMLGKPDADYVVSNGTRQEIWWYDEDGIGGREINIYFRKDRAVEISTSLPRYKTADGLTRGSPLSTFNVGKKSIKLTKYFVHRSGGARVQCLDDRHTGIGYEFDQSDETIGYVLVETYIHKPGSSFPCAREYDERAKKVTNEAK